MLTEQADTAQYVATMEPGNRTKEDALFTNIDNTSLPIGQATGMPDDVSVTNPNQNVSHLDGTTKFSPYAAVKNNPLLYNDLLGDTIFIDNEG